MKNFRALILILLVLIIGYFAFSANKKTNEQSNEMASSIIGCYVAGNSKDVYTMNVKSQTGENITGTLNFNNYQKDSSSGSFTGTYKEGVILADYTFASEGTTSEMEVIFKKVGEDFIRGYGDVNSDGVKFVDTTNITYESNDLSLFKKSQCN